MSPELSAYFERLRAELDLPAPEEEDVVRELRAHVEDRIQELRRTGLDDRQAERAVLRSLERPRTLARRFQPIYRQASWHDALVASAAFLLAGVLFALHLWDEPIAVVGVAAAIVVVTLYGLWQGRPAWFYPWAGLALTLLSFFGYLAFVMLEASAGAGDVVSLLGFGGALLYFPLALAILMSCILVASRRDWLDASLMLSPTAPLVAWLAAAHGEGGVRAAGGLVPEADAALAATFLAMALASAIFVGVRSRRAKLATILATGALVLVALGAIYDAEVSLAALSARALLLFGFLLSPAALEALTPPGRPARFD